MVDQISSLTKEGQYLLDVELPPELITTHDKKLAFQAEMTGQAEVITDNLRMIERVFFELRRLLSPSPRAVDSGAE